MILTLFGCHKIQYKTFITEQEWLSIEYPSIWNHSEEYEGTYLFKNDNFWNGSFRITPLKVSGKNKDSLEFNIEDYLKGELKKNIGSHMTKIGSYMVVNYTNDTVEDGIPITMKYWIFGKGNTIIIASYTAPTSKIKKRDTIQEIRYCNETILRLKIK